MTQLMMHIVAGYPTLENSEEIAKKILNSCADFLEIQIPFSDPIADGPVIALANEVALKNGASVQGALKVIASLARSTQKPIFIMTYFNIIHHYGIKKFCRKAMNIGIVGLIVPDYPLDEEEGNQLLECCRENHLSFIPVIASNTREERMKAIVKKASRFVYCAARPGITGQKTIINAGIIEYLKRVRTHCPLPIAVGFGLSEKKQMEALKPYADIAVIGSALIKEYSNKPLQESLRVINAFMEPFTQKSINSA